MAIDEETVCSQILENGGIEFLGLIHGLLHPVSFADDVAVVVTG